MSRAPSDLLQRAADGEPVALPQALARTLLAAPSDAELASALGLTRAQRIKTRDQHLIAAAQLLDDGCAVWHLAGRLAQAIQRFRRRLLPALRAGAELDLSPVEAELWRAFRVGTRHLLCRRRLYELLLLWR